MATLVLLVLEERLSSMMGKGVLVVMVMLLLLLLIVRVVAIVEPSFEV